MAKVENPRFRHDGKVICSDCPWADKHGATWLKSGCGMEGKPFGYRCPINMESYAAACRMADELRGRG